MSIYGPSPGTERVIAVKELDKVINALESITGDPERRIGDAQLARLSQDCVELSRLECFLPGAYTAATALLEGIQAARLRSKSVAQQRMLAAVELLRALPLRE
jgi:hypothetical protein